MNCFRPQTVPEYSMHPCRKYASLATCVTEKYLKATIAMRGVLDGRPLLKKLFQSELRQNRMFWKILSEDLIWLQHFSDFSNPSQNKPKELLIVLICV
jgi:hypothetical protein